MEEKIIKLPRNGPKQGQSIRAWLYGKNKEEKEWEERKQNYYSKQNRSK